MSGSNLPNLRRWLFRAALSALAPAAMANSYDQTVMHPAIPLLDEAGTHVLDSGEPYSPRMSCGGGGGCHDYEAITSAFHFQMGREEASDDYGRERGLPQLVSPGYFGGYNCMGGSKPTILSKKENPHEGAFMDMGAAGVVQSCARCHPGGGWMERDREGVRYDEKNLAHVRPLDGDYYNRGTDEEHPVKDSLGSEVVGRWDWRKSGVVEADCLMCHARFSELTEFPVGGTTTGSNWEDAYNGWLNLRRTSLIAGGFFREAATAMLEYYNIDHASEEGVQLAHFPRAAVQDGDDGGHGGGDALLLGDDGKPVVEWNAAAFDGEKKVRIPMLRFPGNDNCMMCHLTSNSRRGFYGFGDEATLALGEDGVVEEDYMDDVHKGVSWTDDNGETRRIENCNTCHSRLYLKPTYANVDLDANHDMLKGNSDMDLRNDLDYDPNAKSCEYCHDTAANPAIPSGQASMLDAHRVLWRNNGDMAGYEAGTLDRITQTHLDEVSCQACHITGKASRGTPLQIMYRYRLAEDGRKKIIPYNPRIRSYWKDRNSDRVLSRQEVDSVFAARTDDEGNLYGAIVDPDSGEELARVTASRGMHGLSFGDPGSYGDFVALKGAYDRLLAGKGYAGADLRQVWIESNEYIMSHNTRPSPSSLPCADCHARKQNGSFSALLSTDGVLGAGRVKTVTTLPDRRLVDEGLVVLGEEYFRVDDAGVVTENVDDILYTTKVDPFMSALRASSATVNNGRFKQRALAEVLDEMGFDDGAARSSLEAGLGSERVYLYNSHQGDAELQGSSLLSFSYGSADLLFPSYRAEARVFNDLAGSLRPLVNRLLPGAGIASSVHQFKVIDQNNQPVTSFAERLFIKIPYSGTATAKEQVRVVYSADGATLALLPAERVVMLHPHGEQGDGYLMVEVDALGYFVAVEREG